MNSGGLRRLMPLAVKRQLAAYLRRAPEAAPSFLSPKELAGEVTCIGTEVRVDPSVRVEVPQGLAIGNNVTIGKNVHIDAQGGVILCDDVQVCDHVTIASSQALPESACDPQLPEDRAFSEVFIGSKVWIGRGACILPGVTIGEGAKIAAGTLVSEDVRPRAVYGLTHAGGVLDSAVAVPPDPESLLRATDPTAPKPCTGRTKLPDICFVASTGRSGSTTIADLLSRHPRIVAKHEPRHQLIKLSTEYAHGLLSRDEVKVRLERMFLDGSVFHEGRVHVESDLKYFNLFPVLHEIFPDARFIWLVRSGYDVVTSTYSRSWFSDSSHPVWHMILWFYHKYRVRGDLSGDLPADKWAAMTPFQRNCWYWVYVNETIERDLTGIPASRAMFLRLEDLDSRVDDLVAFLGVEQADLDVKTTNEAFYTKAGPENWTSAQSSDFERICGPLMKRLYG